jgi:hypothetical protein
VDGFETGAVAFQAGQAALCSPAAISVHDDGYMARRAGRINHVELLYHDK